MGCPGPVNPVLATHMGMRGNPVPAGRYSSITFRIFPLGGELRWKTGTADIELLEAQGECGKPRSDALSPVAGSTNNGEAKKNVADQTSSEGRRHLVALIGEGGRHVPACVTPSAQTAERTVFTRSGANG